MKQQFTLLWVVILFLSIACAVLGWRVIDQQQHQNDAIHSIMCFSENYVSHSKKASPAQKQQVVDFYNNALKAARLDSCSN